MKNIKYLPKVFTSISFLLLLCAFFLLFMGRKTTALRPEYLTGYFPDFYLHVSNLCISYLIYSSVGYFWLLMGVKTTTITLLGIIILALNFIYERWISVLNTPDMMDAYYGVAGTIIAFIFLLLVKRWGLKLYTHPPKKD